MKKTFCIVLLLFGILGYSQKLDCSKFKNAKFGSAKFYGIMKASTQEFYMDGKLQSVWNVEWLNDCKFETICIKNVDSPFVRVDCKCRYEIINIEKDCYTFIIHFFNEENVEVTITQNTLCVLK